MEGIGIALDLKGERMFVTEPRWFDLFGQARRARLPVFTDAPMHFDAIWHMSMQLHTLFAGMPVKTHKVNLRG
jgi:hypothetical protein